MLNFTFQVCFLSWIVAGRKVFCDQIKRDSTPISCQRTKNISWNYFLVNMAPSGN